MWEITSCITVSTAWRGPVTASPSLFFTADGGQGIATVLVAPLDRLSHSITDFRHTRLLSCSNDAVSGQSPFSCATDTAPRSMRSLAADSSSIRSLTLLTADPM